MGTSTDDPRRDEVFALPDDRDDDEHDAVWLDDPSYDRAVSSDGCVTA